VRATDPAGNTDGTPASRSWTISAPAPTYAETMAATAGLRHWWRLGDTGTTAADSRGTNAGTYTGGAAQVAGLIARDADGARDFDGVNDFVDLAPGPFGTPSSFSVEAWVRIDVQKTGTGRHVLVTNSFADMATDGFVLSIDQMNRVQLFLARNSTTKVTATSTVALTPGTTYHLAGTYDGQRARVYVNAVERASVAYTGGVTWHASRDLLLGRQRNPTGAAARWLDGKLDEVALYDQALGAATVQGHYDRGR
jgi:large repetitive protein